MKLNRQKFIDILSLLRPGLSKKAIVEQTTHFVFTGKEVVTFNDQICIAYPFKTDFTCSVPAEEFYKILSGITVDDIELIFEKDKLNIIASDINAALATDTGEMVIGKVKNLGIEKALKKKVDLPEDFIEALSMCMFSASKDATRPELTCLMIEDQYIASTDSYRISEYKMKASTNCFVLIPAISVVDLVKYNIKSFYTDEKESWVYFFTKENLVFCSRIIVNDYPDYIKHLKGFTGEEIKLPKDMKRIIATSSILAEGEFDSDKEIDVEIVKNKLRCRGQNSKGWISSSTKIEYNGDKILFTINPLFLDKILDHTTSMFYGEGKVLFKDKSFKHVVSLKSEK